MEMFERQRAALDFDITQMEQRRNALTTRRPTLQQEVLFSDQFVSSGFICSVALFIKEFDG